VAFTALERLGGLLVVLLLAATLIALVRLLVPRLSITKSRGLNIAVVVFALLGVLAVSGAAGMMLMHLSMIMTGCCQAQ
jgi:hypothetical protein